MHHWREHICANFHFKVILCIEFYPLQSIIQNKVLPALGDYSEGFPSIRYILYWSVLMLFHVQVTLIAFFTPFADVLDLETLLRECH